MNTRFIRSIVLLLGLTSALFVGIFPLSFAPAQAQVNSRVYRRNSRVYRRDGLSKYSAVNAPFLSRGSRGQAVRDVQVALQSLGFYNGAIDGIYGDRTARAVTAFQRSRRLVGDGQVGVLTWQALRNSSNARPTSGPF